MDPSMVIIFSSITVFCQSTIYPHLFRFFVGVLGQLERKEVDVYFKGETEFIDEPFLRKTFPFNSERILIGHIIFDDKEKPYFDLISNFTVGLGLVSYFLAVFAVSFFCFFALVNLARRISTSSRNRKSVFESSFNVLKYFVCEQKSLSSIQVFLVALNLCFWFNRLFISNSIKTSKVVSSLIEAYCVLLNAWKGLAKA